MRNRLLFALIASSIAVCSFGAIDVHLSIDADRTLQGIPVGFAIRVQNDGPDAVTVPPAAVLVASSEHGESFTVYCDLGSVLMPLDAERTLEPKTAHVYDFSTDGTLFKPAWYRDGRLFYRPATYRLEVYLVDKVAHRAVGPSDLPSTAWHSNIVTLTVAEPHGVDAVVWAELQRFGGGSWHPAKALTPAGEALAKRIVAEHPDSAYAGWLASFGMNDSFEECADRLRDWLSHHDAGDELSDRRTLLLATWDATLADVFSIKQPEKSQLHKRQALSALQRLDKQGHSDGIRAAARQKLQELAEE